MLATCDDSLEGIRDRALLCFGPDWRGGQYLPARAQQDPAGRGYGHLDPGKPVLDRAALALQDWLDAAGITEGAIFRRLWKKRICPCLVAGGCG